MSSTDLVYSNQNESQASQTNSDELHKQFQAAGINLPREIVNLISSSPQRIGDVRKNLANPAPVALMGFLICLSPLSCDLMGWRGAGGNGSAGMGSYYFFGGLLMILGGLLEYINGKTFSFVVFSSFGAYWLTLASTLQPFFQVAAAYAPPNATSPSQGYATVGFTASFGFFQLFMGVLCFIYLICSIRTNICFIFLFFNLTMAYFLITAVNWELANAIGSADIEEVNFANRLKTAAGAFLFAASMTGWYIFIALMFLTTDFPILIPVGDLSKSIKGGSQRLKERSNNV